MIYQRVLLNFATSKYFVLVWRNLKTSAAATNYIRTADNLCIVQWSETEILNICTFCKKIVCQQRYLTSVLFVNRHNRSLYCPITNATCFSVFNAVPPSIWISYKTTKLHDICLCHSYMFRCGISYKTTKLQKMHSWYMLMLFIHV